MLTELVAAASLLLQGQVLVLEGEFPAEHLGDEHGRVLLLQGGAAPGGTER